MDGFIEPPICFFEFYILFLVCSEYFSRVCFYHLLSDAIGCQRFTTVRRTLFFLFFFLFDIPLFFSFRNLGMKETIPRATNGWRMTTTTKILQPGW